MRNAIFKKTQLAQAVALGVAVLGSGGAMAQMSTQLCAIPSTVTTTVSTANTGSSCDLGFRESLVVTSAGSVVSSGAPAVTANEQSGSINNSGLIQSATDGIRLSTQGMTTSGTIVNSGTITGGTGSAGIGVTVGGGLTSITNSGTISGTTGIRVNTVGSLTSITNSGTISGTTSALSLPTSGNGVIVTNTGTITGRIDLGVQTLELNGTAGDVQGVINSFSGGQVDVNGTYNRTSGNAINAAGVTIMAGGVLNFAESASVNNSISGTMTNAGTLQVAPGKVLTVGRTAGGSYNQTTDGSFKTDVASNTSYGKMLLLNSATLPAGAKINVNVIGSPTLTASTVLTDVIKVDGTGQTLTSSTFDVTDNSSLFNFRATQNGNAVDLTIVAGTSVRQSVDDNSNSSGQGIASEIDRITAAAVASGLDALITALGQLATPKDVSDAVKKLLPLMVTSVKQAGFTNVRLIERVIQARVERNHGLSAGDEVRDRQLWVKPVGAWADQGDLKGVSGFKSTSSGIVFGADNAVSARLRAGAALSYTTSQIDGNSSAPPNTAKLESYRLIGYGSYNLDEVTDIHFQADVGVSNTKGSRTINFAGATVANSDYQSISTHLSAGIGRSMQISGETSFTPSASLSYSQIQDGAYTETGAGALNLKVGANSAEELVAAVEGKLLHNLSDTRKLSLNVGAGYDLLAKRQTLAAAFVGGGSEFITNGLDVAPWSARLGVGYIAAGKTLEVTARYDVELREASNNQTLSVKLRMPF